MAGRRGLTLYGLHVSSSARSEYGCWKRGNMQLTPSPPMCSSRHALMSLRCKSPNTKVTSDLRTKSSPHVSTPPPPQTPKYHLKRKQTGARRMWRLTGWRCRRLGGAPG
eukprot:2858921-Rhodomonas_salina.1